MKRNKDVEIRIFGSRKENVGLDASDDSQVAEIIRTQVLPKTKAEYYLVNVKIKRNTDQTPKYLIAYLLRKDVYLAEVVKVDVGSDYQSAVITWDYDESKEEEEEEGEEEIPASDEDYAYDFVAATPVDTIPSAKKAVQELHNLFTSLGYNSKMLLGAEATVANYKMYLTSGLKGFVNVGHGNTNLIVLADGTLDATWFNSVANQALKPSVTYFNSCQVHNEPLKSAVMKAGARTFIGGITNLLIGASEEVCKCFWGKALKTKINMGDALHTCEKEKYPSEGAHGITGATGPFKVPTIKCPPGPIRCPPAPIPRCPPAPIRCPPAPIRCPPAPIRCPPAPIRVPIKVPKVPPIRVPIKIPTKVPIRRYEEELVPVVVMVPKETAEAWMAYEEQEITEEEAYEYALQAAEAAYCAALEELGMSEEYSEFPSIKGCKRGPFDPQATE